VDLTNLTKCIESYQRKLLLSLNSLVKLNSIRAERLLSTPAAAFLPLKGNPQQANRMIIDRRCFLTKSGAIAICLLANSVVAQPSRAVTQPSVAISFRQQLNLFSTATAFH
jgi:hypothetical protein